MIPTSVAMINKSQGNDLGTPLSHLCQKRDRPMLSETTNRQMQLARNMKTYGPENPHPRHQQGIAAGRTPANATTAPGSGRSPMRWGLRTWSVRSRANA